MQQMMAYIDKCEMLAGIVEQEPLTSTEVEKILIWANEQFAVQEWEDATRLRKKNMCLHLKSTKGIFYLLESAMKRKLSNINAG